jgi:hypothetical protein
MNLLGGISRLTSLAKSHLSFRHEDNNTFDLWLGEGDPVGRTEKYE